MENQALNITAIRDETRHKWLADRRKEMQSSHKKRTLQDYVGSSVPYWLVLIAAVFYLLSAPHTAATFDTLTPGWGWAAPIGVEFGLLFVAFRRKQTKPTAYRGLRWLLILTAILVNGAGSFSAVMDRVGRLTSQRCSTACPRLRRCECRYVSAKHLHVWLSRRWKKLTRSLGR
jgi:hypothetical protein